MRTTLFHRLPRAFGRAPLTLAVLVGACVPEVQASNHVADVRVVLDADAQVGANRALVDIEVCDATGAACMQVPRVLLDTGSTGLLLRQSAWSQLHQPLHRLYSSRGPWGQCARFDKVAGWSWVAWGVVGFGGLRTVEPIPVGLMVNDGPMPPDCDLGLPDAGLPADINGILGVAPARTFCGGFPGGLCPVGWRASAYYTHDEHRGTWHAVQPPGGVDLANPVAHFPPGYDDGIVLRMPSLADRIPASADALHGELHLGVAASHAELFGSRAHCECGTTLDTQIPGAIHLGALRLDGPIAIDSGAAANLLPHALSCFGKDCPGTPCQGLDDAVITVGFGDLAHVLLPDGDVAKVAIERPPWFRLGVSNLDGVAPGWAAHDAITGFRDGTLPVLGMPFFYGRTIGFGIAGTQAPSGDVYPDGYVLIADTPVARPAMRRRARSASP